MRGSSPSSSRSAQGGISGRGFVEVPSRGNLMPRPARRIHAPARFHPHSCWPREAGCGLCMLRSAQGVLPSWRRPRRTEPQTAVTRAGCGLFGRAEASSCWRRRSHATLFEARAEDRAMLRSNPSAVPGTKTDGLGGLGLPSLLHRDWYHAVNLGGLGASPQTAEPCGDFVAAQEKLCRGRLRDSSHAAVSAGVSGHPRSGS